MSIDESSFLLAFIHSVIVESEWKERKREREKGREKREKGGKVWYMGQGIPIVSSSLSTIHVERRSCFKYNP